MPYILELETTLSSIWGALQTDWYETCGFDVMCAHEHHMGIDGEPSTRETVGAAVVAPCTGIVKEAQSHNGYGGMVIMECWTGDECVNPFIAHMYSTTLQVYAGESVTKGDLIGYIADSANNGGWTPHIHFGIRKGSYSSFNYIGCYTDPVWSYSGYPYTCYEEMSPDMYPPDSFIASHQSTTTPTTSSVHLFTVEPNSSGKFNLYGYEVSGSGESTALTTAYSSYLNTGSTTYILTWLVGDVDLDGWDDIMSVRTKSGYTYANVYLSNGDGTLNAQTRWKKTSGTATDAFLSDVDGDGAPDLILAFANSDNTL